MEPSFHLFGRRTKRSHSFDNCGVGESTSEVPDSIKGMTDNVVNFPTALKLSQVDIYGFNMGGYTAQQIVLDHPDMVQKLLLSGTGPGVGMGKPNIPAPNAAEVGKLATSAEGPNFEAMRTLFFYPTESSRAAATEWWPVFTRGQRKPLGRREVNLLQELA